jgi:Tfp pilus assembly protein PilX
MMTMRRPDLHDETGSVLVVAVVLMAAMLMLAISSYAFVDGQQRRALEQRRGETALNLAEAVLSTQGFALAQTWPGNATAGAAMPVTCSSATVQSLCPDPATLAAANATVPAAANFTNVDASADVSWTTRIRDNGGQLSDSYTLAQADAAQSGTNVKSGTAYSCIAPCRWDANGDRKLWVQATTTVRNRSRSIVALLKREQFSETFAQSGVTAGSFETTNNGNKTIIDAAGSQVVVRCTTAAATCTDYVSSKDQVLPATIVRDAATPPAMSAVQIARFKAAAQSASPSTYYTSCPSSLAGTVVYIDVANATACSDANNATYNSAADPGIVIMPRGTLSMKGTLYGLVYMANGQNSSAAVLTMQANSEVLGGVAIDGPGRLVVGQSSGNQPTIKYEPNAFSSLATFGTTGLVQNTWRELLPA